MTICYGPKHFHDDHIRVRIDAAVERAKPRRRYRCPQEQKNPVIHVQRFDQPILSLTDLGERKHTMAEVAAVVARVSGVPLADMQRLDRTHRLVDARMVFCYLAKHAAMKSLSQIAAFLGGRDHTTILNAVHVVETKRARFEPLLSACIRELGGL